ncbi:MAG: TRAP transporter large permease [Syntrophobacteraceae bacterium]|jgi:tripartite ATP-independent transporter DctM subunit|nr:TRAP transporter large permease [Syntrophobacteraceae bacterium]
MLSALILFGCFFLLMFAGVPIAASLGLAGTLSIALAKLGIMAVPTNVYAGIAKYPLLAIPMFVMAGAIFDRSGVAERLLRFTTSIVGRGRGSLAAVTILVAMIIGGISGSGPACTAAVGGVMLGAMMRAGYPPGFAASVTAAAGSTDILIPPSVAFVIYSVLVPSATVPALFVGGIVPGVLACIMLIIPSVLLSLHHDFGVEAADAGRPPFWKSFKEAFWALMAPVLILGGMRTGWFTPTEAAVMAVAYGLVIGVFVYRTLSLRDIHEMLIESAETSAVILIVVGLASVFAWASSTLGIVDPLSRSLVALGGGNPTVVIGILMVFLVVVGMFLDGISIFLIFCPLLIPVAQSFQWDLVWFGVLMTYNIALGQFTPPMAVNLMVSCRLSGAPMEATVRWVAWLLVSMFAGLLLLIAFPGLVLWLPRVLGFM